MPLKGMQLMSENNIPLKTINIDSLEQPAHYFNLFYDISIFMDYVSDREVKRAHRTNGLQKSDLKRLIKLMSISSKEASDPSWVEQWVGFIDEVCHRLRFINYETEGVYLSYTSREPCYPDNYINTQLDAFDKFIALPLQQQFKKVLDVLIDIYNYDNNEFMVTSVLGYLDRFSFQGCATGVLPSLQFNESRRFLLTLLSHLPSNVWYSTASLVQYLKEHHPYFLIPKFPRHEHRGEKGRYCNFKECQSGEYERKVITDDAIDAFERVEGRYIERFLEHIPQLMGFVDVAYDFKQEQILLPERHKLKAFKINPRMHEFFNNKFSEAKVTIQPNFEISVEAEIYPIKVMWQLTEIGNLTVADKVSQIKIDKNKIIEKVANEHDFDPANFLRDLSGKPLSQNVEIDLKEWAGQGDAIILYENCSLLESTFHYDFIDRLSIAKINKNLNIVRNVKSLTEELVVQQSVPIEIEHNKQSFSSIPKAYKTLFSKQKNIVTQSKKARKTLTLKRQTLLKISFPSMQALNLIKQHLLLKQCFFDVDDDSCAIIINKKYENTLQDAIKSISRQYQVKFNDEVIA